MKNLIIVFVLLLSFGIYAQDTTTKELKPVHYYSGIQTKRIGTFKVSFIDIDIKSALLVFDIPEDVVVEVTYNEKPKYFLKEVSSSSGDKMFNIFIIEEIERETIVTVKTITTLDSNEKKFIFIKN